MMWSLGRGQFKRHCSLLWVGEAAVCFQSEDEGRVGGQAACASNADGRSSFLFSWFPHISNGLFCKTITCS